MKAEFEAEGTRVDELLRLVDIARSADLDITVKVGGCEAIRNLYESKQIGVRYIVAPMVETPYALREYAGARDIAFQPEDRQGTDFLFNMETITGFQNLDSLIEIAVNRGIIGIVFGRVEFVESLGLSRNEIYEPRVSEFVQKDSLAAENAGLDFVLGGAISSDSLPVIKEVQSVHLSRFETRKVVFAGEAVQLGNIEKGLLNAVHFELLWLTNKRDYYAHIASEDQKRISMLDDRWRLLSSEG